MLRITQHIIQTSLVLIAIGILQVTASAQILPGTNPPHINCRKVAAECRGLCNMLNDLNVRIWTVCNDSMPEDNIEICEILEQQVNQLGVGFARCINKHPSKVPNRGGGSFSEVPK